MTQQRSLSNNAQTSISRDSKELAEATAGVANLFLLGLEKHFSDRIEEVEAQLADRVVKPIEQKLAEQLRRIEETHTISVISSVGQHTVTGLQHKTLSSLIKALVTNFPIMLIGPAGTGKTFAAEQVAQAFGIPFYAMSVGSQTSKSDLLGYMTATGSYVRTHFREAFENGGLFCIDEIDAGNPNVLVVLNAALSGHFCAFPDTMVTRHKDFKVVATANTYGTGANRLYVGRNQLDAATLDRFVMLDWDIDEKLEDAMIAPYKHGRRWTAAVRAARAVAVARDMRVIISPRATLKGAQLLDLDFPLDEVVQLTLLGTAAKDHATVLSEAAWAAWDNNAEI